MKEKIEQKPAEHVPESAAGVSAPEIRPTASRFPTIGDLLAMLGIALAVQVVVGVVGQLLAAAYGLDFKTAAPNVLARMTAVLYLVSMSVTLAGVLYYRHLRGGRGPWAHFSLRGLNPTLLLWAFVLIFAVGIVLEPLLRLLPDLKIDFGRGLWAILSLVVLAPLFEEFLCRGVILGSLRARYGVTVAWLGSSLFFGVLHVQPVQVVSATIVGLILGYVCLATESLWSAIILHALNNAAAYLLMILFVTPGGEARSALLIDLIQSPLLYGSIYVAAVVLCLVSGWMIWHALHRMKEAEKNRSAA